MCEWTAMGSKKPENFWVGTKNPLFSLILLCVPNITWPPFNLIWKNFILYWDFGRFFCMYYQLFFYKLRSDNWITPKCTLLNFTSKTEAICENEETQARIMYSDASVVHRISDCSTYFRKFPNVAYKKVLKKPTLF